MKSSAIVWLTKFFRLAALALVVCVGVYPIQAASSHYHSPLTNYLVVSPSGPYTTITAALADARAGDVIEVRGGTYPALVVDKSVTLEGVGWPVIDGGGDGTVALLSAPGIVFRGFEVRGSGVEPDRDHSGIILSAADITVENNHLSDVLFGVFVSRADRAIVRGNDIISKAQYDAGRKGDGIRVWYSSHVLIEANHLHRTRDMVLWYAESITVRDNFIEAGRYGIHLMYCNDAVVERNRIWRNSVGIFAMYSHDVALTDNDVRGQRGPSGYAFGFKDAENVTVTRNVVADNRVGIYLDGTPFNPGTYANFTDNILAFNDVGVTVLTAVRGNAFEGNTFWENIEQVAVQGGGDMGSNMWRGNYWSDYAGYDLNGDGTGDTPYNAERFFESLTDREPMLRALIYSPAAQTIELAAASFPIIKPQPKLTDAAPRMTAAAVPPASIAPQPRTADLTWAGLSLLLAGASVSALALVRGERMKLPKNIRDYFLNSPYPPVIPPSPLQAPKTANDPAGGDGGNEGGSSVRVENVVKRYGKVTALNGISFEAQPGEAIALWGENGAGKTTLIKAILGLIEYEGHIDVEGCDARRFGKAARRSIGYVPQEAVFYDQSVQATMEFYARLKKVALARIPVLLDKLGLSAHRNKAVNALSGGLKQRLALAVALLADPPVLLLDEPTANLDSKARRDYVASLVTLRKEGKTILFASHRLEEVESLANRVLVLEAGRVVDVLAPGAIHLRLAPDVELTLWVREDERPRALSCLEQQGLNAHLNGRGTVVVRVSTEQKLQPLTALAEQGIEVLDFEMERGRLWN